MRPGSIPACATWLRARALIGEVYPGVVEVPWPRQNVVGYGVGPKKMSEHFCHLAPHGDHVNLGFNQGAELPDPGGCRGGQARRCATRRSRRPGTSRTRALRELLEAAKAHREATRPARRGEA